MVFVADLMCESLCLLTPHPPQLVIFRTNQLLMVFLVVPGNDLEVTVTTLYNNAISNKVLNIPGMTITCIRIRMLLGDCIMEIILNCIGYIVYFVIVYTGNMHTILE